MLLKKLTIIPLVIVLTITFASVSWAENTPSPEKEPSGGAVAGAVVSNLIFVPGKAGICVISAAVWTAAMILTFGTVYKEAGKLVYDSCSGKWLVMPEDMVMEKP